ncbi:hydroxyquinol 1,2-dioxygenase [Paraburkholderia sp. LEh10]|uniref:hydroxyquinol 1,2-dioxygenase n=1 Tax=Paraburkholderia sp. LEh10 TaxID=2821353 RepID=UPI001AE311E6|nr:hydroxyquinol 1,2-dioxygenase [Paraburkholderia sp. LEh10]MBP0595444.1 hydroxyquinol 1,2-dioxygenase [Paraburkholderia sp. LEh10]
MQQTWLGSLDNYRKGSIEIIKGKPEHYAMSNVFEVASQAAPYEKIVVGKNLKYVIETLRAQGSSPWFTASHDEFCVVMDGEIDVHFIKPSDGPLVDEATEGSVRLEGTPSGKQMGFVRLRRGHQALLPAGAAYRFETAGKGVLLVQTILGRYSVEKWKDICIQ